MKSLLVRTLFELASVYRYLGIRQFFLWLAGFLRRLPSILSQKSLGPADEAFGTSFYVKPLSQWLRVDQSSTGLVREIMGQRCYTHDLHIPPPKTILDLGSNTGIFTLYALSVFPESKVHSVEAQPELVKHLISNITNNGFGPRWSHTNALVGGSFNEWSQTLSQQHPDIAEFDISSYLDTVGTCDLMKCDVEGGEYPFFENCSGWIRKIQAISLEYHGPAEQGQTLKSTLEKHGFHVTMRPHGHLGYLFCTRKK